MANLNNQQIASIILSQLGGSKFAAMVGVANAAAIDRGVSFKIGRNAKGITHVRVILTAMDDYQMEFLRVRGASVKPVAFAEGVYAQTLASTFASKTGMAVTL